MHTPFLSDRFGRRINYVRISITEHCNFRCVYCSPAEGTPYFDREDHLKAAEYDRLLQIFARLGVQHVRLTGGEPLIHPGLLDRVRCAKRAGIPKVSLSTNGYLLDRLAGALAEAGVARINVSLDSLEADRFNRITRGGKLGRVLAGLDAARQAGIPSIKLNVVLQGQDSLDELPDLVEYARQHRFDIQFIETMPLGMAGTAILASDYVSVAAAKQRLERHWRLEPVQSPGDQGPARAHRLEGSDIRVGFISPISENFCSTCNRVRLTAAGRLVFCLGQEAGLDLLPLLRQDPDDAAIASMIRERVWFEKPERHFFNEDQSRSARVYMMRLGG
ncbi:GTP 3',8-cyclase MoaA [Thermithiobacillus plumbiphilus]|uniref:GTP 3',8-cyclase n=1 Tax=Thermithiobacillus plumbiphilus TaxID=1729899 RepID=A0ABU9DA61_9PROT